MLSQIKFFQEILEGFVAAKKRGESPAVDRKEIVAHATLAALTQHWPGPGHESLRELLGESLEIKETERSRWLVQRRIALAKLAREPQERLCFDAH